MPFQKHDVSKSSHGVYTYISDIYKSMLFLNVKNKSHGISLCFHCVPPWFSQRNPRCRTADDRRNGDVRRQRHGHLRNDARGGAATELSALAQEGHFTTQTRNDKCKWYRLSFFVGVAHWWHGILPICAMCGESNFGDVLNKAHAWKRIVLHI